MGNINIYSSQKSVLGKRMEKKGREEKCYYTYLIYDVIAHLLVLMVD